MEKHFENIPENWQIVNLEKLGKCINGLTYSPDDIRETGSLVLRSSNVQNDFITYEDNVYVREDLRFNPTQKGDVLICVRNGSRNLIGKTARITERSANNAFGAFMTIYRSTENDFLNYFFKSSFFFREVHRNLGATINSINNTDLLKFKVPLPSEKERVAIANCLSTWDVAIEKQTKLIAAKEQRKKALMQQLLSGKKRLPGFTEDWKEVRLCDICDLIHGYQFRDHDFSKEQTNYAVVKINNIQNGYFRNTELSFITEKRFLELKRFQLFEDDILMSLTGNIGRVVLLPKFDNVLIQNYRVGKFVEKNGVLKKYLKNILSSEQLFNQFNNLSNQSAQANFGKQDMDKLKISIPRNISEQNAVADILENSAAEIELEKKKLLILKRQKKGMMQNLLSGRVRLV